MDFTAGPVDEEVVGEIDIEVDHAQEVNAVRLAGRLGLTGDRTLGATHALNGDRILPINPFSGAPVATLLWRYRMGAGLGSLKLECAPAQAPEALERATRRSMAAGASACRARRERARADWLGERPPIQEETDDGPTC